MDAGREASDSDRVVVVIPPHTSVLWYAPQAMGVCLLISALTPAVAVGVAPAVIALLWGAWCMRRPKEERRITFDDEGFTTEAAGIRDFVAWSDVYVVSTRGGFVTVATKHGSTRFALTDPARARAIARLVPRLDASRGATPFAVRGVLGFQIALYGSVGLLALLAALYMREHTCP